jgi:hypothetical protein
MVQVGNWTDHCRSQSTAAEDPHGLWARSGNFPAKPDWPLNEGLQSPASVWRFANLPDGHSYFCSYFHGINTLYLDSWMNCLVLLFDGQIDSVQLGLFLVV